jgi:beta-lactamase regulating signal transducer with metallopeptidase domain
MDLSFMQNELVLALCWTLIHSLWQGLLLAILTGAVMIGTRKSNARKRYGLLTFLFFLFIAVAAITFVKELNLVHGSTIAALSVPANANGTPAITTITPPVANDYTISESLTDRFKDYFDTHASLIVMIWFVIFIARFIRLTANLAYVQRLKHYKTYAPPAIWRDKVNELVLTIGIKKHIQLLESGVVKVPVVMGVLKPVILLPLGLLSHLPADEIEAILLHELAHIKRRDYFMNLLQSFAETIFFFNPALMWLSSMIREERENCCDDIAISITNSKTKFINALIAFQEYHFSTPSYTVGFPGRKNQLLNRVKRIISDRNKTLNATEKSLLTFGMGIFILFSFAAAKKISPATIDSSLAPVNSYKESDDQSVEKQIAAFDYRHLRKQATAKESIISSFEGSPYFPVTPEFIDTTPRKLQSRINSGRSVYGEEKTTPDALKTYSTVSDSISNLYTGISIDRKDDGDNRVEFISATRKDGTLYNFRKVNGNMTELFVNNKPVNTNEFVKYDVVINDIETVVKYRRQRSEERRELAAADRETRLLDKQTRLNESRLKLNEQHLLDREARRISADHKRDLFLDQDHRKLQHDSSLLHKQKDLLLHKQQDLLLHKQKDLLLHKQKDLILHQQKDLLLEKSKPKLADKVKLDVARESEDRIKLGSKIKMDTLRISKKDRSYIVTGDKLKVQYTDPAKKDTITIYSDVIEISEPADQKTKTDGITKWNKDGYARYGDVVKYADLAERDEARRRKQEGMRARSAKDEARVQESAEIMRNIIKELEADGITINMQTGWFALDKGQFIVDGKKISAELHEKYKNKFIKPKEGWGYYYGPIKVEGKGVFLEYKNLVK